MADDLPEKCDEISRVSFRQNKLVGIEYPGHVEDVNKMLQTIGGEEAITQTNYGNPTRLELCYRPEDPYCHPMCGDSFPTSNLLLKVKKKRKKGGTAKNEEVKYEQEILGIVDTTFRFESMADFQYLAPDVPDFLSEITGLELLNIGTSLHLPPASFTRFDRPTSYNYKSEPQTKRGSMAQKGDDLDPERLSGTRKRQRRPACATAATLSTEKVPCEPHPKAIELAQRQNDMWDVELKKLFDRRPMWTRMALLCHMECGPERLKQLLPSISYYWLNGPWRSLWTKFGYDPRKEPSAKIYQSIDFRVSRNKKAQDQIKIKKSTLKYSRRLPYQRRAPALSIAGFTEQNTGEKNEEQTHAENEEAIVVADGHLLLLLSKGGADLPYVFQTNKLPKHQQVFYQLCDLHDSEIQELVSANDGQETECHDRDGWCLPGTHDKIRKILVKRTLELIERRKQEEAKGDVSNSAECGESTEHWGGDIWTGFDDTASFLEMLQNDDDVEAYDILEDEEMVVEEDG